MINPKAFVVHFKIRKITMKTFKLDVYLVTDRDLSKGRSLEWVVEEALKGGADIVQLREKDMDTADFVQEARRIKKLTNRYGKILLINDRIDVAMAVGADGVHIGQKDIPYTDARRLLGPEAIIGLSVESLEQADEANAYDVDYIAISPVYRTPTKEELINELGLDGVRAITRISRHKAVGIGSIKAHNAAEVIRYGANGVAVVSGICGADDPRIATQELKEIVEKAKNK